MHAVYFEFIISITLDSAIQKTLRQEFAEATVLTVAHRLNTIMDSDKIVVMEKVRPILHVNIFPPTSLV